MDKNTNKTQNKNLNTDPASPLKLQEERPWQPMFPPALVQKAKKEKADEKIVGLDQQWRHSRSYTARYYLDTDELKVLGVKPTTTSSLRSYRRSRFMYSSDSHGLYYDDEGEPFFHVRLSNFPAFTSEQWNSSWLFCSCKNKGGSGLCVHEVAFLMAWEKMNGGPCIVEESNADFTARQRQLALAKRQAEEKKYQEQYDDTPYPALDFITKEDHPGIHIYDMRGALASRKTNAYSVARAQQLMKQPDSYKVMIKERQDRYGQRILCARMSMDDDAMNTSFLAGMAVLQGGTLHIHASNGYCDSGNALGSYYDYLYMDGPFALSEVQDDGPFLNINAIVLCCALWDVSDQMQSQEGDLTDDNASEFFQVLEQAGIQMAKKEEAPPEARKKLVALSPRIIMENGAAKLSFRIEQAGSRSMIVKKLPDLIFARNNRKVLTLSKRESIDFSKVDFTEDSQPLYDFIQRRVGEVNDANDRFEDKNARSYYSIRTINITSNMDLKGALLDGFYDTWQKHTADYTDKNNSIKDVTIPVGHKPLRLSLTARKLSDARDAFAGVAVDGLLPILLEGSGSNRYTLNASGLSRITPEEQAQIQPFDKISDASGYFRFQVGLNHLQEFYYRVVPAFLDSPVVRFKDECEAEAESYLPPEPQFDFWMDCEDLNENLITDLKDGAKASAQRSVQSGRTALLSKLETLQKENPKELKGKDYVLLMRAEVTYDDAKHSASNPSDTDNADDAPASAIQTDAPKSSPSSAEKNNTQTLPAASGTGKSKKKSSSIRRYTLGTKHSGKAYRDTQQETRVVNAIHEYLPERIPGNYMALLSDDEFFDFLKNGIGVLERYGTVHGTDAFRTHSIRPVPQVKFGVSVDSGIMDLSLTSQGLSEKELLSIFRSYHKKKKFHRLSSGDYIDLTADSQLANIDDFLSGLDLSEKDVIEKSAHLPLYRALYLDKLLEEHDEIVSSRDRTYRGLIRNFHTVRDSEIEPPESLESTLRSYQVYGFKWIKTLENAGFGGILADEMGLGKTLQMISVLLSDYTAEGSETLPPSLIVCPASLVYNWQEEFEKFAPELHVKPIAGGAVMRRKAWEAWDDTQVYMISYDLLKRHIAEISEKSFYFVVLDEAQYIKNAGAASTKSVKALKAQHRFALTGTPIENRLSELWSIFDFLMPGFLYTHKDFEKRLEAPITKNKDEAATEKLKSMTSPFILRRRKEDVLHDLPEKLEEVRYVPISGEQQKLYDAQVLRIKGAIDETETTGSKVQVFAELTRIREICCDPSLLFDDYKGESAKREACLGLIRQAIDGGHRMLVFSQFTSMLALLQSDLERENIPYFILTGSTSKEKRIQLVHDFNEGDTPVFLISLKAGGTGLNLTGADVVIHYDPWWNLAAQNQATDRTHRIGQTKQVTVYRLIMKGTIEEKILDLQNSKKDLAESVLEGDNRSLSSLSKEELLDLLD